MAVKSDIMDKLPLKEAAEMIRKAIENKTPLLIRHHADCDGYSAGICLERAILPLIARRHKRESDLYYHYKRLPSKAPFYEYADAIKDISSFLADQARFERKEPLIIVVDNGSSEEDLLSLKKLRLYGAKLLVVDHHPLNEANDEHIDLHINPHKVGSAGELCAGMLCANIAKFLNPKVKGLDLIAALAGVADHSRGSEYEQYLEIAKSRGYTEQQLQKIAEAIDFETYNIGYLESRFLVNDLFFGEHMEENIRIIQEKLEQLDSGLFGIVKKYHKTEDRDGYRVALIDVDSVKHSNYPGSGKITKILSMITDGDSVAIGYGRDYMTFRISDSLPHDVNNIIRILKEQLPHAGVAGGGHAHAGTIRFIPAAAEEVMAKVMQNI